MRQPSIQDAIEGIRTLPTLPSIISQILATTADPEASAVELTRHVVSDQTLSAALLRLVNSAHHGLHRQVDNITQAIVLLGFFEVRNMTLAVTAFRSFPGKSKDYDRTQLWRHSLASAMAADQLSRMSHTGVTGAFVAGLLHDIGKVVFDALYPQYFRDAAHKAHAEKCSIRETEAEVIGVDHAQAGAMLAEFWEFPPAIVEAIRRHHSIDSGPDVPHLAALAALADYVTYQAGLGESANGRAPNLPEAAVTLLHLAEHQWGTVIDHLRENHHRIDEFLGALG